MNFGSTTGASSSTPAFGSQQGFSFGAKPSTGTSGGFSFGAPSSTPSFGSTPATTAAASTPTNQPAPAAPAFGATTASTGGFNFGGGAPAAAPAFNFGKPATSAPSSTPAPLFGAATPAANPAPLFGAATPAATTNPAATPAPAFSFGKTPSTSATSTTPAPTLSFGATPASTAATPSFGATTASSAPTPSFGAPAASTATPSFGATATTTSAPSFGASTAPSFGTTTTTSAAPQTTAAPSFSLGKPATTGATSATPAPAVTAKPDKGGIPLLKNKTLEEILNKWNHDLETFSKDFHRQAVEVGKWDRAILQNGALIAGLYEELQTTESLQKEIEQNLEYIEAQQNELDSVLGSYHSQIKTLVENGARSTPADEDREKAYTLAESLNKQLDDMSTQLSVVIQEINACRKPTNEDDPMVMIIRILNEHLSSLEWIDKTTNELNNQISELKREGIQSIKP